MSGFIFSVTQSFMISIINMYGYDQVVNAFSYAVADKFSKDNERKYAEILQFLREEADAASYGNEYARKFAEYLFEDRRFYSGAMREDAEYPVDGPGGPQQTLLKVVLPMMGEDADLAVKFRCDIVKRIAMLHHAVFFMMNKNMAGIFSWNETVPEEHRQVLLKLKQGRELFERLCVTCPEQMKALFC